MVEIIGPSQHKKGTIMANHYTFVTVNGKSIRVEETEQEHEARIKRLRAIEFAKKKDEERKAKGIVKGITMICTKCKNEYPYSTIPKYRECPRCAILSMYN